ncbi:class I SAM-dependent methyltransferase [Flavobacterium tibetense]|uniref:SAM-dependent methyltransferase n=1 Tax=Flavobacterium tibetense TaxID=2233533 RepID=A0A365P3U1_9FLAO|nr:class I SAM-dependent methyltransferase [Flavobacterium tibetense]RBA29205.1 SAM-dependent methyltransferase [Flavobacterium tibetense]
MKQFWNERYAESNFAYGKDCNLFLKENLHFLPKGKVLFVAEGEGRNAVFAAKNGFEVSAFDYSESGKQKAFLLANENGVPIDYLVSDVLELPYEKEIFDGLVLIFAHFPAEIRKHAHLKLLELLKPGGKILFEAFGKEQLNYTSGGPKDIDMLFSEEEVKNEFPDVVITSLSTEKIVLDEGLFHQGEGVVVRFIGTKK